MKKNKLNILALTLLCGGFLFTSCSEDDATGASTLIVNQGVSGNVVTDFDSSITVDVNEFDEETFTYTVTIDQTQPVDIHVSVKQIAGDATEGDDYDFSHEVVIPAYSTTATGSITILNDDTVEGVETFTLQIGDVNTSNASIPYKTVSFSINNWLSNDLDLAFNFNQDFYYQGGTLSTCAIGYDMDYYVFDAMGIDTGIYDAAASGCPERLSLSLDPASPNYLVDGVYYIYYDIYDDGGLSSAYHDVFEIPTMVEYLRAGGITEDTFDQEAAFVPTSTSGSGFDYVMTIEVAAGQFIIKNSTDDVLASGRHANVRSNIEASILAARARK